MSEKQRSRWPRQLPIRVGRIVYSVIYESPLGWLLRLPPVQRIKYRIIYTPARQVLAVLDELAAAGVRDGWPAGGAWMLCLAGRLAHTMTSTW